MKRNSSCLKLVWLIDAEGKDMAQRVWLHVRLSNNKVIFIAKKPKNAVLTLKLTFLGQSDN